MQLVDDQQSIGPFLLAGLEGNVRQTGQRGLVD
jgi:hypothetical protein